MYINSHFHFSATPPPTARRRSSTDNSGEVIKYGENEITWDSGAPKSKIPEDTTAHVTPKSFSEIFTGPQVTLPSLVLVKKVPEEHTLDTFVPLKPTDKKPIFATPLTPMHNPKHNPIHNPTHIPSHSPGQNPSHIPSHNPIHIPTHDPIHIPSDNPTQIPSHNPSHNSEHNLNHEPSYSPNILSHSLTNSHGFNPSPLPIPSPSPSPIPYSISTTTTTPLPIIVLSRERPNVIKQDNLMYVTPR